VRLVGLTIPCLLLALLVGCASASPPGLPASDVDLRVRGADLVDGAGEPVVLRAMNLGNWLLIEPWMYNQPTGFIPDQRSFIGVLGARFGTAEADRLIGLHRANWMTQRDFDAVAAAGFNAVRIPFSHLVLESSPFVIDPEGMALLEGAMAMARDAGLYVILDMHQVPGGQSTDQPSGDITENRIWTDEAAQERFAWLWQRIARRFKNTPNFVAYDLMNEPFGDFSTDIRDELVSIMGRAIGAIREVDADRLILVPGTLEGLSFYGDPADRGWTNTGFTEHFYPGVFDGNPATLGTHARFLANDLRDRADFARSLGVPYLWGESNPVFDRAGSHETARAAMEAAAALGVHTGVWAQKLVTNGGGVGPNNWYLTTNAGPLGLGDIRTAPNSAIEGVFASLGTIPLATDSGYLAALTDGSFVSPLPAVAALPLEAPAQDTWTAWDASDVGDVARAGGQSVAPGATPLATDHLTIYAAGQDLFGTRDSLRLVSRAMPSAYAVSGVFDSFEGGRFAQSGVTIRASEDPGAAHLSLVVFPDGGVLVKSRGIGGAGTGQRFIGNSGFPVGLALGRSGSGFQAWMTNEDGSWISVPLTENPAVGTQPRGGFFATANREGPLSVVSIRDARVDLGGDLAPGPALDTGLNLLGNPSFESGSGSVATGWTVSGSQLTRETGWTPVRDGSSLLAYRHWQVSGDAPSEASQLVTGLVPGRAYTLTVYASRDTVAPGRALAESVELRVETGVGPLRWLESRTFGVADIATGSRFSRLQVRFMATQSAHRVRLVCRPGAGNRDGAVKFDGLHLAGE
jgi:hypothetical protein